MAIITKISLVLAFVFLISKGEALKCYKCVAGDECNKLDSNKETAECANEETVCFIKGNEKDEKWNRGCAKNAEDACPKNGKDACSTCTEDGCNAATIPAASAILCVLTVVAYNLLR